MQPDPAPNRRGPSPKPVFLRIELHDIQPLIWRRIVVSNQSTLASLHNYLQWVMGWQDTHAHEFEVGEHLIAPAWWIAEMAEGPKDSSYKDESRVSVSKVVAELGVSGEFDYRYDMGDGWAHRIVIEAPLATMADLPLPRCTAGENACPPEDVGGPPGYAEFLAALANPAHDEHVHMLEWVGGVFDPKGFDLNRINREWRPRGRRSR
jgi:hypothetical protein